MLMPRMPEELYDLRSDPFQFNNLAGSADHQQVKIKLAAILDKWILETGDSSPLHITPDREDVNGKQLHRQFKKGDKAG